MKKLALATFCFVLATACGSDQSNANRSAPAANKPAAANQADQPTNSNANAPTIKGERVTSPVTVKFGQEGVPAGWRLVDAESPDRPTKIDTAAGTLKFTVLSGKDMYGDNRTAPHLIKPIEGDFQIETRVKFDPKSDYQGAGLFIFKDGNNYIRLERAFGGLNGGGSGIRLDVRTKDAYMPVTPPDRVPTDSKTVDLRILRTGKIFIAFWRLDEESEWKEVGEFAADYPDTVHVGLIACNTSSEIPVEFLYIKLEQVK